MPQMSSMQFQGGYYMPTMPQPQRFFTPAQMRGQRPGGPRPGMPTARPAQPMPQQMLMARPGVQAAVPMQARPGQAPSFKYTPTARNPPQQVVGAMVPGTPGAPPPQQA